MSKITWEARHGQFSIDYCLMSHKLYTRLEIMQIDEDGEFCLVSDHYRIRVSFEKDSPTVIQGKHEEKIHYSEKQLEEESEQLEMIVKTQSTSDCLYNELVELISIDLLRVGAKSQTKGVRRRKPKAWWYKGVVLAIKERQKSSRDRRNSKKEGRMGGISGCKTRKASGLVQAKIGRAGVRWMKDISGKGKTAASKVWKHVKSLSKTLKNNRY